jgi:predicted nucleic acid-binding protein
VKIIIDTNIIFSALLNTNGTIGEIIFDTHNVFEFYSCSYMRYEIEKHWDRLKRISKLSEDELKESFIKLLTKISFINEEIIPEKIWLQAEMITSDIDQDDLDFVAFTIYMKGVLWTGDIELYKGLKKKGFKKVINTKELLEIKNNFIK